MYRNCDGIGFIKSLPDQSVDGIFTDPPWGSGPDIPGQDQWKELVGEMASECPRILKPGARVVVWVGMRMVGDVIPILKEFLDYRWMFMVHYIPPRYMANFESSLDPIILFQREGDPWPKKINGRVRSIYQKASTGRRDTIHPCARPFITVKHILSDLFKEGEYIIDPFAGSDTTGRASRELGLKWDTCEISPELYETGLERHRQGILFE